MDISVLFACINESKIATIEPRVKAGLYQLKPNGNLLYAGVNPIFFRALSTLRWLSTKATATKHHLAYVKNKKTTNSRFVWIGSYLPQNDQGGPVKPSPKRFTLNPDKIFVVAGG